MSKSEMPSCAQMIRTIISKHKIQGTKEEKIQKVAEMMESSVENIQNILDGKEEMTFHQAGRIARVLEKLPINYIAFVGFQIALKEESKIDEEMWYGYAYRNCPDISYPKEKK
jgi:hypothetical protein